ncbi:MAG: AGE family epimerase/isomerase [Acidobacteria bacterium]|nr:AGE family epimerase/isomerase [Acidobacteriota bacterium]
MRVLGLVLLSAAPLFAQAPLPSAIVPEMEKVLNGNIVAFWYPKTIDAKYGGYTLNHGPNGEWKGDAPKMIVTQARMVWLFARLARAGHGDRARMLQAADHGYRFLMDKMWDPVHGGFYWGVDATGGKPERPKKNLYGQSFALYALSEFAMASGRRDVLDRATGLFRLLEQKSHDSLYGGYREQFNADWTPTPPGEIGSMGVAGDVKLMNTHLHLLEALTTFYRASKLPLARERLLELITIESNTVFRKDVGSCSDQYKLDWTPILQGAGARSSYGHDLENIWLLVDAASAAGVPVAPYLDLFRHNFAYSMKYGWDSQAGGFWYWGPFGAPAAGLTKSWWVQAEALVSALTMYQLTSDPQYWEVFLKTWEFVKRYQVDWQSGEWWSEVDANLKPSGGKANEWKAGYHNGRAMLECIALLKGMKSK